MVLMKSNSFSLLETISTSTIQIGGYSGIILERYNTPAFVKGLQRFLSGGWSMDTEVARAADRDVHRCELMHSEVAYIKRYHLLGLKPNLRSLLKVNKAQKAWRIGRKLQLKGIDTPQPIALLKHRISIFSFDYICITKSIEDAVTLREAVRLMKTGHSSFRGLKMSFINAMAKFVAQLHIQGIYHGDFAADNVLIQHGEDGADMRIFLIDLDAVRTAFRISNRRRVKNIDELGRNFLDLRIISTTDRALFIRKYLSYYRRDKRSWRQLFKVVQQRTEQRLTVHHKIFTR